MQVKDSQLEKALHTALLILLLSAVGMTEVYATYDFSAICSTGQTLYYNIIDASHHYVELTCPGEGMYHSWDGFTRPTGDIALPSIVTYNGTTYSVKAIGDYAFLDCIGLTGDLTIPSSVTTIGDYAFYLCTGFTDSLTIGNSVTTIGELAFYRCTFLGSLTIPNTVTTISSGAFSQCNGFTGSLTIGNSVTTIGELAFQNCSGFTGSLTIPNSVTTIDRQAFINCNGFSEVYYNAVNCEDVSSTCITYSWFPFDGVRGTLTIGNDVEKVPQYMFKNAYFTGVNFNATNCTEASNCMLSNCSGTLTIGSNVERIPDGLFYNCTSFTGNLTIPSSVITIGDYAFYLCTGFTGVYYTGDINQWCNITFGNSSSNPLIHAHNLYINNNLVTNLIIPETVTEIKDYAFYGCSCITGSLTIPNSVNSIGKYSFCECSGFIGSLTIGNSVTMIGSYAFMNCRGFTGSLTIPSSVNLIGGHAFENCGGFTGSLTIGNSVTSIGVRAFSDCRGITSLTIGNSVTEIGSNAFYCNGLNTVDYYTDNCLAFSESAFYGCPITTVNIGENVQSIPANAFTNCPTLNIIIAMRTIPPTLGNNAFTGISPVATLFVPCGSLMAYFSNWNIFEYNNIHEDCTPRPVSIDSNITGGTVSPSVSQASMGEEVMLTVIPNPGMQLASITAYNTNNPSQIVPISPIGNSYRFVMPPYAVTISATFDTCVLVEENSIVTANVYPNPTTGHVKIEAEDIRHIRINNILGQVIYESVATGNEFEYYFSKHGEGIYLIRIETASGVVTKRVVVTR